MSVKRLEDGIAENRREYSWKSASATIAGTSATTDLTGVTGFEDLFTPLQNGVAHHVSISVASGTAYFRLNNATNDVITVTATSPYTNNYTVLHHLYASTAGAAVTITVKLE